MKSKIRANPVILAILGCDMIFIIEHRLKSQNIQPEKQYKVLSELSEMIFQKESILNMNLKPSITLKTLEQIFQNFINSSIMRLNQQSLTKLLDLMFMSLKFQTISCNSPIQLYNICINNLNNVKNLIQKIEAKTLIIDFQQEFNNTFSIMSAQDYFLIKQDILRILQDKNVRVTLLLNEKVQNQNGFFKITSQGLGAPHTKTPGLIIKYDGFKQNETHFDCQNQDFIQNQSNDQFENETHLGSNIYLGEFQNLRQQISTKYKNNQVENLQQNQTVSKNSKQELNQLKDIFISNQQDIDYQLNLNTQVQQQQQQQALENTLDFNLEVKDNSEINKIKNYFDDDFEQQEGVGDQDLLDLMDQNS